MSDAKKPVTGDITTQDNHAGLPGKDDTIKPLDNHAGSIGEDVLKPADNHAGSEPA